MKTLIIIDVQNDFMPGGALPVPLGYEVVPVINSLISKFDLIVATQDWHPLGHKSFASSHQGKKAFEVIELNGVEQILWPEHCVQSTVGAEFHPGLKSEKIEAVFRKGMEPEIDSYSGFYDNRHLKTTGLSGYLKEKGAKDIYFCGLAADICVYFTIMDALQENFSATLIEDASRPLNISNFEKLKGVIQTKGANIVSSEEIR